MKLLLDQNISRKLVSTLIELYPETEHVTKFKLEGKNDFEIRIFALENNFVVVTQDADFFEMMLMNGFPPKIIWLRCGNTSSKYILELLIDNKDAIEKFQADENSGCIELE